MSEKNKAAQELGHLGGAKGGRTPEESSESARKAANARWAKKRRQVGSS